MFDYQTLVTRNSGYVSTDIQTKLSNIRILVAGCGIGSAVAIALTRFGVQKFILVDGDMIEAHNLNRQFYTAEDVGALKVDALARHITSINPNAEVYKVNSFITAGNITEIDGGKSFDLVIDCIDFIDIEAIQALHLHCLGKNIPLLSIMNIGFGAGSMYFNPVNNITFRDVLGYSKEHKITNQDYIKAYAGLVTKMSTFLDPEVTRVFEETFKLMAEGRPCPASQVVSGVFCCGVLAPYLVKEILLGHSLAAAPHFMFLDIVNGLQTRCLV